VRGTYGLADGATAGWWIGRQVLGKQGCGGGKAPLLPSLEGGRQRDGRRLAGWRMAQERSRHRLCAEACGMRLAVCFRRPLIAAGTGKQMALSMMMLAGYLP